MAQIRRGKVVSPTRLERRGDSGTQKLVYPTGYFGATLRSIHVAPNKMRLVVDQIRGESVERAREILRFSAKRAAYYVDRVLLSALGNADVRSDGRVGAGELYVAEAYCDAGAQLRRLKAGPMGRGRPIRRRTCHITVVLGVMGPEEQAPEEEAPKEEGELVKS